MSFFEILRTAAHLGHYLTFGVVVASVLMVGSLATRFVVVVSVLEYALSNIIAHFSIVAGHSGLALALNLIMDLACTLIVVRYGRSIWLLICAANVMVAWGVLILSGQGQWDHSPAVRVSVDLFSVLSNGLLLAALASDRRVPIARWASIPGALAGLWGRRLRPG